MTALVIFGIICWLYWKFLKAFIGPFIKAIDVRLIAAFQRHTRLQPDMAKAVLRLIEFGLILLILLETAYGAYR